MPMRRRPPVLPVLAMLLAAGVVADPAASLAAARRGVHLWWTAVLPSLLPFFMLNDLLQALGVVKALGVLLEPLMRPLFALPGAAGLALAMGFTSGFPAGARAAARLTSAGLCSREEGSRLAAFANAAGPLFVTGVAAVSLFRSPAAAVLLAFSHYGAALLVGFLLARLPSARPSPARRTPGTRTARLAPGHAWRELQTAAASTPPLGQLLGSVVREAGESVLVIGGFIVFFSVLISLVEESGVSRLLLGPLEWVMSLLGLPPELAPAGLAGLLEVTSGLSRVASAPGPLAVRLAFASVLLAWSGFSVHAQAVAVSAPAGLSYRRFLAGRLLHTALSPLLLYAVWPLAPALASATPVFQGPSPATGPLPVLAWSAVSLGTLLTLLMALAAVGAVAHRLSRRFCVIWVPRRPRP